jgi:hypothetical protein
VLNVRLYIQVNVLTSVADELIALNTLPIEFQFSETKYESVFDETITTIKKREKQLIDGITKHSQKLKQTGHLCLVFITSNVV